MAGAEGYSIARPKKRQLFQVLRRGTVSRILLGSLIGQGAILLASPLLTRLYSPADFASLAVVTAVAAVLGSIVTLSWDRAIVIPEDDARANAVVRLGLLSMVIISTIAAIFAFLAKESVADLLGSSVFRTYWWLVPATVAVMGIYSVASSWLIRRQNYTRLATRNAVLGLSQAGSSVVFGLAGVVPLGLISSVAVGRAVALIGIVRVRRKGLDQQCPAALGETARMYQKFPLVNTWSRLLNSLGLQLPVILIVSIFGSIEAGFYALTLRVLASPVGIISDAVSQYFEGAFAKKHRSREGGLHRLMVQVVLRLAAVGAVPVLLVLVLGPQLFGWAFGDDWVMSGKYAQILIISYFVQLVVSPISRALIILQLQGSQLLWDATRLVATSGAVMGTALSGLSFVYCALALMVVQVVWYILLLIVSLRSAKRADKQLGSSPSRDLEPS